MVKESVGHQCFWVINAYISIERSQIYSQRGPRQKGGINCTTHVAAQCCHGEYVYLFTQSMASKMKI